MQSNAATSRPEGIHPPLAHDGALLLEFATPTLYRRNAFRVLGLPVTATTRVIATQVQKLQVLASLGRSDPALQGPFALKPAPTDEALRAADRQLSDPQLRLLHELFWFWPLSGAEAGGDAGYAALKAGDVSAADRQWQSAARQPQTRAAAIHNLAVLWHLLALSLERRLASDAANPSPTETLSKAWDRALAHWDEAVRTDQTWNALSARVLALDNNRLSPDFVQGLRSNLAYALVRINAHQALTYAQRGQSTMASAHIAWVLGSGLKMVDGSGFAKCIVDQAKTHLRRVIEDKDKLRLSEPSKGADSARELLNTLRPYGDLFEMLESATADVSWHEIVDELADMATSCLIAFQNNKGDEGLCLELLKKTRQIAHREALRGRIEECIRTVEGNIVHRLLAPVYDLAKIIRESPASARDRLARFENELRPQIANACGMLEKHRQSKEAFLNDIAYLLRGLSVDAWNNGKDTSTANRALDLADSYAAALEIKARLQQDRAALYELVAAQINQAVEQAAAQRRARFKNGAGAALVIAFLVLVAYGIIVADQEKQGAPKHAPQSAQTPAAGSSDRHLAESPSNAESGETGTVATQGSVGNDRPKNDESAITESGRTFSVPRYAVPELDQDRAAAGRAQAAARTLNRQLDGQQAALHQLQQRIDALEQTLESEKATAQVAGAYAVQQFNADVDRYNAMVGRYRSGVREVNALIDRYNQQERAANTLVDTYNEKLRRYGHCIEGC